MKQMLTRTLNAMLSPFGVRVVRTTTVERLTAAESKVVPDLRAELDKVREREASLLHELVDCRDKVAGVASFSGRINRHIADVERRYVFEKGAFLEPDGQTYTFTNMELETARFLQSLILLHRPKVVVETGTHQGYSATYVAQALKDGNIPGHIWTIDPFEVFHLWEDTDLARYVTWVRDYSQKAIGCVPVEIDFLILDSLHTFDVLSSEVELYEPKLRVGGMMFLHDTLVFPDMSPVVHALIDSGRFETVTFETPRKYQLKGGGSGVTLLIKRKAGPAIVSKEYRIVGKSARSYFSEKDDAFSRLVLKHAVPSDLDYVWPSQRAT